MRLFFGVELDEHTREALAARVGAFVTDAAGAAGALAAAEQLRWLAPRNWHFTLQFLGPVQDERVTELERAGARAAAACAAFEATLGGAGAFPSARRASVVWIGVRSGEAPFAALAEALFTQTEPLGFEREQRAFRAHLTVARLKQPASVEPLLAALHVPALPLRVAALTLFRSQLSSKGAEYEALARFALG